MGARNGDPANILVLASQNPGKVAEIAGLLVEFGKSVLPRPDWIPETDEDAGTLEGNAIKKAREVSDATGLPAMADDTGLFVDALDGAPGVLTARFGGWEKLLAAMEGNPVRAAHFRTVLAISYPPDPAEQVERRDILIEGECRGWIAEAPTGDGGFGYDPIFIPEDGDGRSFAEMSKDEKSSISHRGRALRKFLETNK